MHQIRVPIRLVVTRTSQAASIVARDGEAAQTLTSVQRFAIRIRRQLQTKNQILKASEAFTLPRVAVAFAEILMIRNPVSSRDSPAVTASTKSAKPVTNRTPTRVMNKT